MTPRRTKVAVVARTVVHYSLLFNTGIHKLFAYIIRLLDEIRFPNKIREPFMKIPQNLLIALI